MKSCIIAVVVILLGVETMKVYSKPVENSSTAAPNPFPSVDRMQTPLHQLPPYNSPVTSEEVDQMNPAVTSMEADLMKDGHLTLQEVEEELAVHDPFAFSGEGDHKFPNFWMTPSQARWCERCLANTENRWVVYNVDGSGACLSILEVWESCCKKAFSLFCPFHEAVEYLNCEGYWKNHSTYLSKLACGGDVTSLLGNRLEDDEFCLEAKDMSPDTVDPGSQADESTMRMEEALLNAMMQQDGVGRTIEVKNTSTLAPAAPTAVPTTVPTTAAVGVTEAPSADLPE